jgi:hypothetical protein
MYIKRSAIAAGCRNTILRTFPFTFNRLCYGAVWLKKSPTIFSGIHCLI